MEKTIRRIALYSFLTLVIVVSTIGILLFKSDTPQINQSMGGQAGVSAFDVVGSRIGTSTTAVDFADNTATSTYISRIDNSIDSVVYSIYNETTSAGGGANAYFSVLGSNDSFCDTIATSTTDVAYVATEPLVSDIHWFDLGDNLRNKVHSTSLAVGTSSVAWLTPSTGTGRDIILEGLNTKCISLGVNASGTSLWIQAKTKKFK